MLQTSKGSEIRQFLAGLQKSRNFEIRFDLKYTIKFFSEEQYGKYALQVHLHTYNLGVTNMCMQLRVLDLVAVQAKGKIT
jgi:hypothetical protein